MLDVRLVHPLETDRLYQSHDALNGRPNSIAWPKLDIERSLTSCSASLAPQLPLKRQQARIAGPPLQQPRVRDDRLVPAGMAAGTYLVENAQILEAKSVARRHSEA